MSRQDKLILILQTGTSPQVRRTAAQQLAELTVKTFKASTTARTPEDSKPDVSVETVTLTASGSEEEAWNVVLETVTKLLPLLQHKTSDTRHAAAAALGLLAQQLPSYTIPVSDPSSSTSQPIDIAWLLRGTDPLLASAGREYIAKPLAGDRAKRRKAMMNSVGLGDTVGWGDDVDNVIGDEDEGMDDTTAKAASSANGSNTASPAPGSTVDIFEGLSVRQIAVLKRKKGNIVEEANKCVRSFAVRTSADFQDEKTESASGRRVQHALDRRAHTRRIPPAKARTSTGSVQFCDHRRGNTAQRGYRGRDTRILDPDTRPVAMGGCTGRFGSKLARPGLAGPTWRCVVGDGARTQYRR
jgi:TATA-binding protein-associated factor